MSEPRNIKEVHELLKRMQDNKKVDPQEVAYYLKKAITKKESHGVWVKQEQEGKDESLSVVRVDFDKELVALRLNGKKKGRM